MESSTTVPIQIHLAPAEVEELEAIAARRQVSLEDVVRQSVASLLSNLDAAELSDEEEGDGPDPLEAFIGLGHSSVLENSAPDELPEGDPFRDIIGMFASGLNDLAENHDKYLMEYEMEHNRPWPAQSS